MSRVLEIASQLEEIIAGLSPGDQIPTRREVERVSGASRSVIEKAVYYLLGKGLVEIRMKGGVSQGVFVAGRKE